MWRFALQTFILLNYDFVSAKYFLNSSKVMTVTWKDAQKLCNVPPIGDIMYTKKDFNELPKRFTAWTSSRNLKSDWTSFYGCLDVSVNMVTPTDVKHTLNQYFPNSTHAVEFKSVFSCAFFCTKTATAGNVFTFFKQVCKCFYEYELKSTLLKMPVCIYWDPAQMESVDEVYSISRHSLPIFKFESDLRTAIIQYGDGEPDKHHCLSKTNSRFTTNDCTSKKMFYCDGGFHGYGTWTTAINMCAANGSLLKKESDDSDHWLSYFKYEDEKANEQCVAILRTNNSPSLTYKYRSCSECLPVLCVDQSYQDHISTPVLRNQGSEFVASSTESNFERTTWPTLTNMSNVERPVVGKIVVVNVVLFGLCSLFVVLIIFRKRLALQVSSKANQKLRRNNINIKSVVQRDGNGKKNKGKCQNENNMDRDNYVEPWEMRQNIVHMDEPCQQDIIDVQTEETET